MQNISRDFNKYYMKNSCSFIVFFRLLIKLILILIDTIETKLTLEQRLFGVSSVSSGFENSSLENFRRICLENNMHV